ncbi:alpha/beta hydrolase [Peptostreptococcus russellii]|uniref:alpha/beta fold hydrolase n=1 Tax=Peptostreptococcus russellii TaxID=215200 RepID=UPI0016232F20|nr:alpha/beta hydrolase [Peptostreptococcus russellii]MBC2577492.1 alpha/beta hydrolase [Peptostreptococcus russellii]
MKIETFGNPDKPVALLVHSIFYPGVTSYKTILPLLMEKYYVVIPNLNGLTYPHTDFVSTRKQADEIIKWLKDNKITEIAFLLGSSYGSSVAFEILKEQWLQIDRAALDSPALKSSKFYGFLFYCELKKMVKKMKKMGMNAFKNSEKYRYLDNKEEEYCLKVYQGMDKKSLKDISYSCYDYTLPSQLYRKGTKVRFLFGEKDKAKINLPEVRNLKSGEIRIVEGMSHMQLMFEDPVEFLQECGLDIV